MRLEVALQGVFLLSIAVLALLPFLHGYLAATSEENRRLERELEEQTKNAVEALSTLKATSTMFDQFVLERQKRRGDRLAEQQRLALERSRGSNRHSDEVAGDEDKDGDDDEVQLARIKARIQKEHGAALVAPIDRGAIGKYADAHNGALPILIVCYNRPKELGETLDVLLKLKSVNPSMVLVSQDGSMKAIKDTVESRGLPLLQNLDLESKGWAPSGRRIAWHYKFSLNAAFDRFPDAPAIIILEDDLHVSPDFVDWFAAAGGVLEKDPSLWCVSAWNDNGFRDIVLTEDGPYRIKRTSLFPGLGWLLLRSEFDLNLRQQWPDDQWDWFVRGVYQRKERECLYPDVPRTFHAGRKGTFVNENAQRTIFDRMIRNERADLNWRGDEAMEALSRSILSEYDTRIELLLMSPTTIHVKDPFTFLEDVQTAHRLHGNEAVMVIWYDADPNPQLESRVMRFVKFFGIWHQLLRAAHESMHEIFFQQKVRLFLINTFRPRQVSSMWFTSYTHQSKFARLKPSDVPAFDPEEFITMVTSKAPDDKYSFVATEYGESCHETCSKHQGKVCDATIIRQLNSCVLLKKYLPCTSCEQSTGEDQPCMVNPNAPSDKNPGSCLVNTDDSFVSCTGKHALTKRLCACK